MSRLQWSIALVALAAVLLASGYGLPSAERMDIVNGGNEPPASFLAGLTAKRVRPFSGDKPDPMTISPYDAAIIAYRAFVLGSALHDERHVYSTLSRMRPGQLDFDPGSFVYGGAYTYSVGVVLFVMKAAGLLVVTPDIGYYAQHPEQVARMYMAGRGLNIAAFFGLLVLIGIWGNRVLTRRAATYAMLFFVLSPMVLSMAVISKPHLFGAFFVLLGLVLLDRACRDGLDLRWLAASGASMGFGVGSAIVIAPVFLIFPVALWLGRGSGAALRGTCVACLFGVAVYCAANPYVIIHFNDFLGQILFSSDRIGLPAETGLAGKLRIFVQGLRLSYSLPLLVAASAGLLWGASRPGHPLRAHAIVAALIVIVFSVTVNRPRMSLFLAPVFCLLAGSLLKWAADRLWRPVLGDVVVALVLLPWLIGAACFVLDRYHGNAWYEPTRHWVESTDREGQMFAFMSVPGPETMSPVPISPKGIRILGEGKEDAPEYVVLTYPQSLRWKSDPMSRQYSLQFRLRPRKRGMWLVPSFGDNYNDTVEVWKKKTS